MGFWQRQLLTYHPVIGWWFIPSLRAMISSDGQNPYLLQTNSLGMRSDREWSLTRPNGRRRIIVLGDSYAAGYGVADSDRFSNLLEKSHPNLDVMNFGLPGSGTDQQLLIYETLARPFEADAYIFAPFHNNILRNLLGLFPFGEHGDVSRLWYRPKPFFTLDQDHLVLHNQPVPNELVPEKEAARRLGVMERWGVGGIETPQWIYDNVLVTRLFYALSKPYSGYESDNSQAWRLMRAIIERFINQVDEKPVLIVPLPDFRHFLMDITPTYLARFEKLHDPTKNCFVVDPLAYFKELPRETRKKCIFEKDPHYSPLGHSIVAKAISDGLEGIARIC